MNRYWLGRVKWNLSMSMSLLKTSLAFLQMAVVDLWRAVKIG